MNKDLEKQIEEAARAFVGTEYDSFRDKWYIDDCNNYFTSGAKSEAAKQYWFSVFEAEKSETEKRLDEYVRNNFDGKPSYSEEEVYKLIEKQWDEIQCPHCGDSNCTLGELEEWFNNNKKK